MNHFEEAFNENIVKLLKNKNINTPTEIQKKSIEIINTGVDTVFQASTGTGKTLAYLLPIIKNIDNTIKTPQSIILAPTHELASQVYNELNYLCKELNIETALLIGGANINRQVDKLKSKPKIIVGTAGRILDLVKLKKLKMHTVKTVVVDEFDRMLNAKNVENVKKVLKCVMRDTQIVMCSASTDDDTLKIAKEMCKENLNVIKINKNEIPSTVQHIYFVCDKRKKFETLRKFINREKVEKALVFVTNEVDYDELVQKFLYHNISATYISGDDKPQERKNKLHNFRTGKTKVLLTTDLLSRGLDIKNLYYAINYNLPEDSDIYQHRAGRVGRAGENGCCVSVVENGKLNILKKLEKTLNINFKEC